MREWRIILGPFLIWATHFLIIYGVASAGDLSTPVEAAAWRGAGQAASLVCVLGLASATIWIRSMRDASCLARRLGVGGSLIGLMAVVWQSLPLAISA